MEALYADAELASFYDIENGWADDTRYCAKLAQGAASVLDLCCGTGLLASALGKGKRVVGIDAAASMLAIARSRPGGDAAAWVRADAREVRLGERFDLVVMTGHAFQCFLTAEDRLAVCRTIKAHLADGGRFIFDSRNPLAREWLEWVPDQSRRNLQHPAFGAVEAWNDVFHDPEAAVATYETFYEQPSTGRRWQATARIAFPNREEIAAALSAAGLGVNRWLGSWKDTPWSTASAEIIPIGGAG